MARARSWWPTVGPPFVSAVLLLLAYAPFSVPVLPFVGLVPLLVWLDRPRTARELAAGSAAFAVPYFSGSIYGMALLGSFTPAGIPGYLGILGLHFGTFCFFAVAMNVVRHLRPVALPVAAPPLWLVSEHARAYGDLYFPWVTLGYAPAEWPLLFQHADLVGVYGISFWLVLVNALLAEAVVRRRSERRWASAVVAAALVVGAPIAYGAARWRPVQASIDAAPTLTVAVFQPAVEQGLKWDPEAASTVIARVNRMIGEAEAGSPDLVVGPEACLPIVVSESAARLPSAVASGSRPLLLGIVTGIGSLEERTSGGRTTRGYSKHYNSAALVGPDRSILSRHDKQVLVPVTEHIPYSAVFGFLLPAMQKQFGRFSPGRDLRLLEVSSTRGPARFGALICYEVLFPRLARKMRTMGAEFLVNITNDAWFGRTTFPYQHAAFSALRAVESRIAIVRAANTGISAIYDPLGRSAQRTPLFREATFQARVPLTRSLTFYDRAGDLVLYVAYAGAAVLLGLAWRRYRAGPVIPRAVPDAGSPGGRAASP